jgi:hypothetical protein
MKTINVKRLFEDTTSFTRNCLNDKDDIYVGEIVLLRSGRIEKTAQLQNYVKDCIATFTVI